jgi:hypothetical protein
MNRIRPTPAAKVLRQCSVCGNVAECYPNRRQCCDCIHGAQKRYRAEFDNTEQARAWQRDHAEYQRAYQAAYYQQNRERIQAQRKGVRCD